MQYIEINSIFRNNKETDMNFNNQELIPSKTILSFEHWTNMGLNNFMLSVTRGMATSEQKQVCYQKFMEELDNDELGLNDIYFKSESNFELWCNNELIGLCENKVSVKDWIGQAEIVQDRPKEKHKETLFLYCDMDAVFILKEYRGKELDDYFARKIRDSQSMHLFGLIAYQKECKVNHVKAVFFCDYYSKAEEHFHQSLYSDDTGGYVKTIMAELGCTYEVSIDADF